ncbi:MAG: hypothetical protein FWE67_05390 [Planctomycetaceae bacterium]|nr:hypothetical protein [Planctomycetaceae bacterium]
MTTPSPLTFRVSCRACFGTEIWLLGRIVRALTEAGLLSSAPAADDTDVERIAELFITNIEQITCSACEKTKVLFVQRIK